MSVSPLEVFFSSATDYYIAGRFAAFAGLNPVVGDRVRELAAPFASYDDFVKIKKSLSKDKPPVAADFYMVSAMLVARLESACSAMQRTTEANSYGLIPSSWRSPGETAPKA